MPRHQPIFYTPLQQGQGSAFRTPSKTKRSSSRRSPHVVRWMAALALLGLLVVGIQNAYPALVGSDFFMMERISVDGNRLLATEDVVAWSELSVGGNLFECDLAAATERLRARPIIEQVLLRREPPETLVISLKEREPIALVNTPQGLRGLSRKGLLFPLPQTIWDLPVVTGTDASQDLSPLAGFVEALRVQDRTFWDDVSEIQVGSLLRAYLNGDDLEIRMSFEGVDHQVRNFKAYINAGAYRGLELAYLDLRYRDQVVVGKRIEAQVASR